jgi:hypothetical protein
VNSPDDLHVTEHAVLNVDPSHVEDSGPASSADRV